ncbi:MAG TPA: hypothetical protein VHE37_05990, partial [Nevskiaceae bacterium]|nr:hypothetical protein [Nevskiaceae bacterium]
MSVFRDYERASLAIGALLLSSAAHSAENLPDVVVSATRSAQSAYDIPAAVSGVTVEHELADTPDINLSEYLRDVAGVLVRDRQNYAQD